MRGTSSLFATLSCAVLAFPAAAVIITLPVNLDGASEFPGPGDADGSASGTMTFDTATNGISWNITYTGIVTPLTGFHIHPGAAGTAGSILVNLGTATTGGPGTLVSSTTTSAANMAMITANFTNFYINIHNGPFSGGAIRGQLPKQYNLKLIGSTEVPGPGDPDGKATGTISLNPAPAIVNYDLDYTDLDKISLMHIHTGASGVGGPVFIDLDPPAGPPGDGKLVGSATSTTGAINTVLNNPTGHYVNIHTGAFPAGAVRNQVKRLGDLDGDNDTDGLDLAVLLGVWTGATPYAPCPPIAAADLNGDCLINGLDLANLLADWLPIP
jgi:hypothetical protein